MDPELASAVVNWAWSQTDVKEAVQRNYGLGPDADRSEAQASFLEATKLWISGAAPTEIAVGVEVEIGHWLRIYTGVLSYAVQTVVEQGIAILEQLFASRGETLAAAVQAFPDHLRYGVPSGVSVSLAAAGVRHRKAYAAIDATFDLVASAGAAPTAIAMAAAEQLRDNEAHWRSVLGNLVFDNTMSDLTGIANRAG